MAKSLIITEKPSVAQEFARILGVSGRNDGYIENSDYVITWCVGHLVEMVYPEVYDEKLSLIHISEPTRRTPISYAVFCLKKKKRLLYTSPIPRDQHKKF